MFNNIPSLIAILNLYFVVFLKKNLNQCIKQEAAIEAKFTEVNAVHKQRLQNLEFAQSLLNQVRYNIHQNTAVQRAD